MTREQWHIIFATVFIVLVYHNHLFIAWMKAVLKIFTLFSFLLLKKAPPPLSTFCMFRSWMVWITGAFGLTRVNWLQCIWSDWWELTSVWLTWLTEIDISVADLTDVNWLQCAWSDWCELMVWTGCHVSGLIDGNWLVWSDCSVSGLIGVNWLVCLI